MRTLSKFFFSKLQLSWFMCVCENNIRIRFVNAKNKTQTFLYLFTKITYLVKRLVVQETSHGIFK